jgi:hypothetical protein
MENGQHKTASATHILAPVRFFNVRRAPYESPAGKPSANRPDGLSAAMHGPTASPSSGRRRFTSVQMAGS